MLQPIFYFDKLTLWDRISIWFYTVLSFTCAYFFYYKNNASANRELLVFYTVGTQLFLYLFNYKSLRNFTVYLAWVFIALVHLFFYFQLKDIPILQNVRGHAATGLRNTIIVLLLYQVLRIISVNTQKQELVAPTRGGTTDIFEGRKITFIDYVLFVVYFGVTIVLNV